MAARVVAVTELDPYGPERLRIMAGADEVAQAIRAARVPAIERACVRQDHETRARLFAAFQAELDSAMAPYVRMLEVLPPPPIIIRKGKPHG